MIALSLALSFLGCLALWGYAAHLSERRRNTDKRDAYRKVLLNLSAEVAKLATLSQAVDTLKAANNQTAEAAQKAIADLEGRVRNCELKAGIRQATRPDYRDGFGSSGAA